MSQPSDLNRELSGIMQELVSQFSDPHAFFRELIQNAIDAGSGEVEIFFEYDDAAGVMTAHVNDFGEGMTREIIESKLTRLFSSAKDSDFTKIGKFGIGFVSVFAVQPDAVCVDTGRNGDFWRVLFDRDRDYELIRLDEPVEGTQVRVIKRLTAREYDAFRARATEVIRYWCRHVRAPVIVDGEEINAAFDLEAPIKVTHEEEGTRVVAGFVRSHQAPYGFYNRGLTLKEGDESPWPHVALKIDSRYLEHTLTRDQVLQDEHYVKAMKLLGDVATERLPRELFARLEEHAASGDVGEWERWAELCVMYANTYGDFEGWRADAKIFPVVMGDPVSARDLVSLEKEKRSPLFLDKKRLLFLAPRDVALAEALEGVTTLAGGLGSTLERLAMSAMLWVVRSDMTTVERGARRLASVERGVDELEPLDTAYMWAFVSGDEVARALCDATLALMRAWGAVVERVVPGRLGYVRGGRPRVAWPCEDHTRPTPMQDVTEVSVDALGRCGELVVNVEDPGVARLIALYPSAPELAAHALFERVLRSSDAEDVDEASIHRALYG